MGVLTDYFRAADRDAARDLLGERELGPLAPVPGLPAVDGVEATGVDPDVVLGALVAAIPGAGAAAGAGTPLVWPDEDDHEALAEGPWVVEVDDAVRDVLARVDETSAEAVALRWAAADELDGTLADDLRPLVLDLAGLARRAADAGERLYCWTCL